jgi:hypothetical protein
MKIRNPVPTPRRRALISDPESMSEMDRIAEIASILAAGLRRLQLAKHRGEELADASEGEPTCELDEPEDLEALA